MTSRSAPILALALVFVLGCGNAPKSVAQTSRPSAAPAAAATPATGSKSAPLPYSEAPKSAHQGMAQFPAAKPNQDVAIFAGGCFWCMETPFDELPGVYTALSGYTAGHVDDPTYELVNTHTTGHVEAVWVAFDSTKVSYGELLKVFWHNVDPTTADRQFCDAGDSYVSAIFYRNARQKAMAEASRVWASMQLKVKKPIVTRLEPATLFWPAEEYHQQYHRKNPDEYQSYRTGCRRDARLLELWGDVTEK